MLRHRSPLLGSRCRQSDGTSTATAEPGLPRPHRYLKLAPLPFHFSLSLPLPPHHHHHHSRVTVVLLLFKEGQVALPPRTMCFDILVKLLQSGARHKTISFLFSASQTATLGRLWRGLNLATRHVHRGWAIMSQRASGLNLPECLSSNSASDYKLASVSMSSSATGSSKNLIVWRSFSLMLPILLIPVAMGWGLDLLGKFSVG